VRVLRDGQRPLRTFAGTLAQPIEARGTPSFLLTFRNVSERSAANLANWRWRKRANSYPARTAGGEAS